MKACKEAPARGYAEDQVLSDCLIYLPLAFESFVASQQDLGSQELGRSTSTSSALYISPTC